MSGLLANDNARVLYRQARELHEAGEHQRSLESLARAIEAAVGETPLQWSIRPGEPDPTVALELTAYGVDPGAYIGLQEFLPKIGLEDSIQWETRSKGHPGNWTHEKVSFCLETALDLLLKVQYAPFRPAAADFTMMFDDILTAKHDGVLVHVESSNLLSFLAPSSQFFGELKKGQQIRESLIPAYRSNPGERWEKVSSIDEANLFIIYSAKTDLPKGVPEHHVIVVQASDVDLSYEPNEAIKELFPHLFPDDGANG
jgi:hypothetical protein